MKKRDLERHLSANGCVLARQAANHEVWQNAATGQRTTVPRHKEIKRPDRPVRPMIRTIWTPVDASTPSVQG